MISLTRPSLLKGYSNEALVSGQEQMARIMKDASEERLAAAMYAPADVLEREAEFRFRYREFAYVARSIVGVVSENIFWNMVRASFHQVVNYEMEALQPNGKWDLVAWRVVESMKKRRKRVPNPNQDWDRFAVDETTPGHGTPNPQQHLLLWSDDPTLVLQVAFVDSMQGVEIDNWFERTGRHGSQMEKYLQTGDRRHLPTHLRAELGRALELLGAFVAHNADVSGGVPEGVAGRAGVFGVLEEGEETEKLLQIAFELRKKFVSWSKVEDLTGLTRDFIELQMQGGEDGPETAPVVE